MVISQDLLLCACTRSCGRVRGRSRLHRPRCDSWASPGSGRPCLCVLKGVLCDGHEAATGWADGGHSARQRSEKPRSRRAIGVPGSIPKPGVAGSSPAGRASFPACAVLRRAPGVARRIPVPQVPKGGHRKRRVTKVAHHHQVDACFHMEVTAGEVADSVPVIPLPCSTAPF